MQQLLDDVRLQPPQPVPHREEWIAALDVFLTEKAMTHQIEAARTQDAGANAASSTTGATPSAPRRRSLHV